MKVMYIQFLSLSGERVVINLNDVYLTCTDKLGEVVMKDRSRVWRISQDTFRTLSDQIMSGGK